MSGELTSGARSRLALLTRPDGGSGPPQSRHRRGNGRSGGAAALAANWPRHLLRRSCRIARRAAALRQPRRGMGQPWWPLRSRRTGSSRCVVVRSPILRGLNGWCRSAPARCRPTARRYPVPSSCAMGLTPEGARRIAVLSGGVSTLGDGHCLMRERPRFVFRRTKRASTGGFASRRRASRLRADPGLCLRHGLDRWRWPAPVAWYQLPRRGSSRDRCAW